MTTKSIGSITSATYGYDVPPDMPHEDTGKCWVVRDQSGLTIAVTRDERVAQFIARAIGAYVKGE